MLNLKNNKNDAVFEEICKQMKIKIKFQKMKGTFWTASPGRNVTPTATEIYNYLRKEKKYTQWIIYLSNCRKFFLIIISTINNYYRVICAF